METIQASKFEVHSYHEALSGAIGNRFPWKYIRGIKVPRNITVDSISTIMVVDWCCMCKNSGESVEHLLLLCIVVRDI